MGLAGGVGAVISQERGERGGILGGLAGGKGAIDQGGNAVADHARHFGLGERRQRTLRHQSVEGGGEVRHAVDQRAIKVQDQGT